MSVKKRGAKWEIRVQANGRRVSATFSTKALAVEAERKVIDDVQREKAGLRPNRSLADALAQYLTTEAVGLKAQSSLLSKARLIREHLSRPIDRIADAAADIIRAGEGLTPATINRRLALLRRLGNLCHQWGWSDTQLGSRVRLLREQQERHVYLSLEDVAQLVDALQTEGAKDAVWLAACTGLRKSELFALTKKNWRDGALWLPTSKSGRPRLVPVPTDAAHICDRLPLRTNEHLLRHDFVRAREACGMPHIRFHDLRHTYASWAVAAGVDIRVLKELMGHSTMQMTSRYAHLQDSALVSATKNMVAHRWHKQKDGGGG